ncbi:ATPase family protein associated with various cellular activities (AAA) [Chitinophaga dinghuensis]|uniref:ATPase family protein associated with various cellular activities (AAA) n=1 Tax=Chitinophaga dinghuensis TaxID=1539050 RepID=A0A327VZ11_9BACT|nr:ATP-binding protein [Chitinophaga dinghuensis]RAJ80135.1 ATPase family protein associated with various cellular activities (AAA) [Chitinophaga dinghuensis]
MNIQQEIVKAAENAYSLDQEMEWFMQVVNARLQHYFEASPDENGNTAATANGADPAAIPAPDLGNDASVYAQFVRHYNFTREERLLLVLTIIPHIQPQLLDVFFTTNKNIGRGFTEFGGIKGTRHGGFIPTIETALFIIGGTDLAMRFMLSAFFEPEHVFYSHNILSIDTTAGEPYPSSVISLSHEYVDFFTQGKLSKPQFSTDFPARRLTTNLEWTDLVVDEFTTKQLDELRIWLQHGQTLYQEWGMSRTLKPGYKALFFGPPGTGKTLTAALLGKMFGLDVYRIDLSMVVSKYIGETEKNLEKVFARAENKNWILFFDEADALFGKRTNVSDAHDRYANQEISYLLQRLEDYPGLVILASNMRNNMDEAFVRRLQAIIHFPKPQPRERLRLWNGAFSTSSVPPPVSAMEKIAQQYELSGGSIINVVQYASLMALNRSTKEITAEDLVEGIRKEFRKEGKTL